MIIHFGRNPVNGGRPPRDNKISDIIISVIGALFHESEIELIDVEEFNISVINIGIVSKI